MAGGTGESGTYRLTMQISVSTRDTLKQVAEREQRSQRAVVERAISLYADRGTEAQSSG